MRCGTYTFDLSRPLIMGIVNVTPDSFSDGGRYATRDAALAHAERLIAEGADLLDIGGESTRPGAETISVQQEIDRVAPVIEALSTASVPVSVDTCKPEVMRAALQAGASMVNDICALQQPGALEVVAESSAAVCLMHMQGTPQTMQIAPSYDDVTREIKDFLRQRIDQAVAAGIDTSRIVVDPGFGFGKTLGHNLELLRRLHEFAELPVPLLAGLSRKSFLGGITGRIAEERIHASAAAALLAVQQGAAIVRVHDVAPTKDMLALWNALKVG